MVVGMHKRVRDCLTHGLVHRIIVDAQHIPAKLERMRDCGMQPVDDPAPKVIKIARPHAVIRRKVINPTGVDIMHFTIIQEIVREFNGDLFTGTEHQ